VKHHLWVLWTDYFKAPHLEQFPNCTTSSGGHQEGRRRQEVDGPRVGDELLALIDEISDIFWKTKTG